MKPMSLLLMTMMVVMSAQADELPERQLERACVAPSGEASSVAVSWRISHLPVFSRSHSISTSMLLKAGSAPKRRSLRPASLSKHMANGDCRPSRGLTHRPGAASRFTSCSKYSLLAISAYIPRGMTSRVHHHSGVEAFYTVDGQQCLETQNASLEHAER